MHRVDRKMLNGNIIEVDKYYVTSFVSCAPKRIEQVLKSHQNWKASVGMWLTVKYLNVTVIML